MIHLLTAVGLSPGGRNTVHIYTQIIHRTIENKQYIEQHNTVCLLHFSATSMAILEEGHYKGYITQTFTTNTQMQDKNI